MNYRYTAVLQPAEEGGYVVTVPALSSLVTQGDTLDEARARVSATKLGGWVLARLSVTDATAVCTSILDP